MCRRLWQMRPHVLMSQNVDVILAERYIERQSNVRMCACNVFVCELNRNKQINRQTNRQTDSQTNRHTVRPRHGNEDSVVIQHRISVVNRTTGELITFITLVPGTATLPGVRRFRNSEMLMNRYRFFPLTKETSH